jgi:hypothetical protein
MRHREDLLYDDGGTVSSGNPIAFLLLLAFMIFVMPTVFRLALVFVFHFWTNITKSGEKSPIGRSKDSVNDPRANDRSEPRSVVLEKSVFYKTREEFKVSATSRNGLHKSESLSFITLYPFMVYHALEKVQHDPNVAFYLLGRDERPVIAWLDCSAAADFRHLPIQIGDRSTIFGYHKDALGGDEDRVSFEVFAETVRKLHKLDTRT